MNPIFRTPRSTRSCAVRSSVKALASATCPENGLGRLLVRGEPNWDLHEKVYPSRAKCHRQGREGRLGSSTIHMVLKNLGITHIVICGITTDVCVHTIMREANDYGYWCVLMKDGTGATDMGNHEAAIKSVKMQGGVFGNVTDSKRFIEAVKAAGLK